MRRDRRWNERAQNMLQLVNAGHKSLADYATIATRGLMDEIRRLAEPLAGKRVVHVSATAFGGGVAEINYTLIPSGSRSEEHTSELQSLRHLVCRLLLEKKKQKKTKA